MALAAASPVHPLDPAVSPGNYVLDRWSSDDGLPQNFVTALLQTRDGFLWLGTQEGVVRFDGVRFDPFREDELAALGARQVLALAEGGDGSLWIGSYGGGLVRFRDGRLRRWGTGEGLPSNIVRTVVEDADGSILLGTQRGLCRIRDGRAEAVPLGSGGEAEPIVGAIRRGRDGTLWVGTQGRGLEGIGAGGSRSLSTTDGLPGSDVTALVEDRAGTLWIGTSTGLGRLPRGAPRVIAEREGPSGTKISCLLEDRDGNVWIGSHAGGLDRWSGGRFSPLPGREELPRDSVHVLAEDREGSLWIGTYSAGLARLKDPRLEMLGKEDGLAGDLASSILADREGNVWIGTSKGLTCWKGGRAEVFSVGSGLPDPFVWSLEEDRAGRLWVGTGGGIAIFSGGRPVRTITGREGLPPGPVFAIHEDRAGDVWLGTRGGLACLEGGVRLRDPEAGGFPRHMVPAIVEDSSGRLWVGTNGGGLFRRDGGSFRPFTTRDGLPSDTVESLSAEPGGTLWIGTLGGGLGRLREGRFVTFGRKAGLLDETVFRILDDGLGGLWLSSNKGIFQLRKDELERFARGEIPRVSCAAFGTTDGMRSHECNGGSQPAGARTADGRLWFPTIHGVAIVDPAHLRRNPLPPPVAITGITVDRIPAEPRGPLRFPPGRGELEIRFSALSLRSPDKVLFRYRLEGFDPDWVSAGTRRVAYFTNIPPGRYTFRVVACNEDGVWNREGAELPFELRPQFRQTKSFYLLIALSTLGIFAAILGLLHRVRVRVLEADSAVLAERNRLAREIHDTVAQGLAGIVMQLRAARRSGGEIGEEASRRMDEALRLARYSLDEARQAIWSLRPNPAGGEGLAGALRNTALLPLADPSVAYAVEVVGTPVPLRADAELHLLRIAREAVTNAYKHAAPGRIDVRLEYLAREIVLSVTDDGRGIDPELGSSGSAGGGFGLASMRQRVEALSGSLEIGGSPGGGTRVRVSIPMRGNAAR
jgi:ligand-binding sensor domain-containing protein/signal transduction histidine kinase